MKTEYWKQVVVLKLSCHSQQTPTTWPDDEGWDQQRHWNFSALLDVKSKEVLQSKSWANHLVKDILSVWNHTVV